MSTIDPLAESPFHRAARLGELAELQRLLDAGADINGRSDIAVDHGAYLQQLTPLMAAARATAGATVATLRWLVAHGADLHARSAGGVSAAWYAAGDGGAFGEERPSGPTDHAARLRFLLDAGLDAHEESAGGRSLLTEACSAGDPARVALLLERGAPVSPLFDAEANRRRRRTGLAGLSPGLDEESQARIEEYGAEWSGRPMSFQLPLFCAVESGSAACVRLLLAAGADANGRDNQGATALMYARGLATVRALLAAGADSAAVDTMGYDAFQHLAISETANAEDEAGLRQALSALIAAGADVNGELSYPGWTRLYHAAFSTSAAAVERLLALGADPTLGRPPLNGVCWHSNDEYHDGMARIIDLLVAAGCDVNARDAAGDALLHCAAWGYAQSPGEDCFNSSSDGANFTAVRRLLQHGADPDPAGQRGWTPLMLAALDASVPNVRELLAAGASPTRQNADESTAVDVARRTYVRAKRSVDEADAGSKEWAEGYLQAAAACWELLQQAQANGRAAAPAS
jgi:ankyrin repeat protein